MTLSSPWCLPPPLLSSIFSPLVFHSGCQIHHTCHLARPACGKVIQPRWERTQSRKASTVAQSRFRRIAKASGPSTRQILWFSWSVLRVWQTAKNLSKRHNVAERSQTILYQQKAVQSLFTLNLKAQPPLLRSNAMLNLTSTALSAPRTRTRTPCDHPVEA